MTIQQLRKEVQNKIASGNTEDAIQLLSKHSNLFNEKEQIKITLFLNRFNELEEENMLGMLSDYNAQKATLNVNLLDWLRIKDKPEEQPQEISVDLNVNKPQQENMTLQSEVDNNSNDKNIIDQPLSAKTYIWVALGSLILAIALLLLLVYSPNILDNASNLLTFTILAILGATAAVFLFGVMRSYATIKGKEFGMALEAGGPIVIFLFVLFYGYDLLQKDVEPFGFTVLLVDAQNRSIKDAEGELTLRLGSEPKSKSISDDGTAIFQQIDNEFKDKDIIVELETTFWTIPNDATVRLRGNNGTLVAHPKADLKYRKGRVFNKVGQPVVGASIYIDELEKTLITDENGRFKIEIPLRFQTQQLNVTMEKDKDSFVGVITINGKEQRYILR